MPPQNFHIIQLTEYNRKLDFGAADKTMRLPIPILYSYI